MANHLTANDIMTIYSDCEEIGYTATGQSHGGFIYPLEVSLFIFFNADLI